MSVVNALRPCMTEVGASPTLSIIVLSLVLLQNKSVCPVQPGISVQGIFTINCSSVIKSVVCQEALLELVIWFPPFTARFPS